MTRPGPGERARRSVRFPSSPSAPSSLDFGVEPLQFHPGVFDAELPVDTALLGIRFVRPRCDLELKVDQFTDAAVAQALARQATQLALGDIQPTSVLRGVAETDPFYISSRSGWVKNFIKRGTSAWRTILKSVLQEG